MRQKRKRIKPKEIKITRIITEIKIIQKDITITTMEIIIPTITTRKIITKIIKKITIMKKIQIKKLEINYA